MLEEGGSLALTERGEADALIRHPDFRVFGAMNPPTDFGKKELPPGIRARFTELYVPPLTADEDLQLVVLAERRIEQAEASAVKEIRQRAADLAVEAAGSLLKDKMTKTQRNALIKGDIEALKGKLN